MTPQLPRRLENGDVVRIGSNGDECAIRIDDLKPVCVEISASSDSQTGGISFRIALKDDAEAVEINGERLRGERDLSDGSRITLSERHVLRLDGSCLVEDLGENGLSLVIDKLGDERKGRKILTGVSFCSGEGEFIGILGPSGCGKSSVIQRLAGLAEFEYGTVRFNGMSYERKVPEAPRGFTAYLPQNVEDALHPSLTVAEELACNRAICLAGDDENSCSDDAVLKDLNLLDAKEKLIGDLSAGQKRRVAIALALQRNPKLILLDEPTAGLDPAGETDVMEQMRDLAGQGRIVICATHVMENLGKFHKVLVLTGGREDHGRAVYFDTPAKLKERFGASTYAGLYCKLRDDAFCQSFRDVSVSCGEANSVERKLPAPQKNATFGSSVKGYLRRSWLAMPKQRFAFTLTQPLLIVATLRWAGEDMFAHSFVDGGKGGIVTALFCAALSMFWLGLIGSVQGLVSERVPGRCLERLAGVSLVRYGCAKLLALLSSSIIESLLFSVSLFVLDWLFGGGKLKFLMEIPLVLFLVCVFGAFLGYVISAWSKSAVAAVTTVPFFAILALFFSHSVIGFSFPEVAKWESTLSANLANLNICHQAEVLMGCLEGEGLGIEVMASRIGFAILFAGGLALAGMLAYIGQNRFEKQWEGR